MSLLPCLAAITDPPLCPTVPFRENQESYTDAGGFNANDDEFEERRGRINEAKQKSA